jgi:REP element-mobilizing transposase RayT
MSTRQHTFAEDNYYHIYAHTVGDMPLFRNKRDHERFLCTLFTANAYDDIPRLERFSGLNQVWDIKNGKITPGDPLVDIACFCLMKTHFHLILGERGNANISKFMHKLMVSFAKYINIKYERRGHVFESKFHSKLLDSNEYLLRASSYIHLNPKDMKEWHHKEHRYPWSTYQDYIGTNRWGVLLKNDIILSQLKHKKEYQEFVEEGRLEDDYYI